MLFQIFNDEPQIWTWVLMTDGASPQVVTGGTAPLQTECLEQISAFKQAVAEAAVPNRLERNWS